MRLLTKEELEKLDKNHSELTALLNRIEMVENNGGNTDKVIVKGIDTVVDSLNFFVDADDNFNRELQFAAGAKLVAVK